MRASRTTTVLVAAAVITGCLVFASMFNLRSTFQAAGLSLVLIVATVSMLRQVGRTNRAHRPDSREHYTRMLVICWVVLAVLPSHSFAKNSAAGALNSISASSVVELGYFSAILLPALWVVREFGPSLEWSRPPLRLFIVPIWVMASAAWSASAPYAVVRGYQFAVIGVLGWATILVVSGASWRRDALAATLMRVVVVVIGLLALSGFLIGPVRSPASVENLSRFAWIGAHPNVAGPLLVVGLLFVVIAKDTLRMGPALRVALGLLFTAGIYYNESRSSLIGLAGAIAILVVRAMRTRPRTVAIWTPFAAVGAYLVLVFKWDTVWDYISRDQSGERLAAGNGRKDLWVIGLNSLDGPFDWLAGHGYGITRTLFLPEESWAGTAHNSILAMLVGLGVVGVVVFFSMYGLIVRSVFRTPDFMSRPALVAIAAVVLAGVLDGMASDRMAEPTDGYALVVFLAALTFPSTTTGATPGDQEPADVERVDVERVDATSQPAGGP